MSDKKYSQKITKEAARDAFEYARAQMATGDGAGNRRKLIKATVDAKAERDPLYSSAFNRALAQQDMAEHASRARTERKRKNVIGSASKNANALNRAFNGPFAAPVSVAALASAWSAAKTYGYDKKILAFAKTFIEKLDHPRG